MRRRTRAALAALATSTVLGLGLTACGPVRTYTFNIATRGRITADVGEFARHVQATLDDRRGWSLGGSIRFVRTDGPSDFTVWLAAADTVPGFGRPCSSMWSCRQGRNVIINQDRWLGASPSWPYGVETYRHYVVNHEVGHWMGFGHASCPAPWVRAPVMVQQSKGGAAMGTCSFNVWPTPGELGGAGARHRVPVTPTGLLSPDGPFGNLDMAVVTRTTEPDGSPGPPTAVELAGWTVDGDTVAPLTVVVLADGRPIASLPADRERLDVAAAVGYGPSHGFHTTVPVGPDTVQVCVVAVGTGSGPALGQLGCQVVK